jgi:hypothetical protein
VSKQVTVYASAARTATPTAVTIPTGRYRSLILILDCTVDPAAASITPKIEGVVGGKTYTLLTGAAFASVSTVALTVGPGLPATANVSANNVLPDTIKVTMTHADSDSITYSVVAELVE